MIHSHPDLPRLRSSPMKVTYEKIDLKSDARGSVWEPILSEELTHQRNCHVVITEPGGVRGNHYHKLGTEIATQTGPARVTYRDETGTHTVEIADGETVRFVLPPNCPHAFQNHGRKPNLLVAFNTENYHPESPDAYSEIMVHP